MKKASLVIICLMALLVVYGFAAITVAHADNGRPYSHEPVVPLDNGRPYALNPIVEPQDNGRPY